MEFIGEVFHPLVVFFQGILGFFYSVTAMLGCQNYGIAIILMTIAIKLCLYPLTVKQIRSMKAMQEIQPAMKKIQAQYKNNPQMMQQQMAALYKDAGVNPLAGCLPLLAQMPILMGIFYALRDLNYDGGANFLWLTTLSEPDPMYILPVLSALTTFLQQKQTSANNAANPQMKMMMLFMPLFIGWISLNFPAGLVIYWVTMNIMQILQTWWMYRGEEKAKEAA